MEKTTWEYNEDYNWLMTYCIHCHYEWPNHEYAGRYARSWDVECPECGRIQTRAEFRASHNDATGDDLGPATATSIIN